MIDLRSDTVTRPDADMLRAMSTAEVGDDVYGEDPTTNALQERVAAMFGKEAGLFVPSGSMSNQLAIRAHTQPGDEVIVEGECHIFHYETAGPAVLSGVQLHHVRGSNGVMRVEDVEAAIRPSEYYFARTRLVCLENTHNRAGGTIHPLEVMQDVRELATHRGLAVHIDGARIWNAHVATGIPFSDYGACCDTMSVCFSKGLGAPVGSMLLGSREFITHAHRFRKVFGGAMRQIGVLTAACNHAIDHNLPRLAADHEHAHLLATELQDRATFHVDIGRVHTNMVFLDFTHSTMSPVQAQELLFSHGILAGQGGNNTVRLVFHLDISREMTERAISIIRTLFP